ncbi:hypothetical protein ACIA6T_08860 [Streptomyces sp. NPDC051740]
MATGILSVGCQLRGWTLMPRSLLALTAWTLVLLAMLHTLFTTRSR